MIDQIMLIGIIICITLAISIIGISLINKAKMYKNWQEKINAIKKSLNGFKKYELEVIKNHAELYVPTNGNFTAIIFSIVAIMVGIVAAIVSIVTKDEVNVSLLLLDIIGVFAVILLFVFSFFTNLNAKALNARIVALCCDILIKEKKQKEQ